MALRFSPSRGAASFALSTAIRGPTGAQGSAATVTAGITSTLAPGASATVVNAGSTSAAVFDFGIPRGADAGIRFAFEASTTMAAPASGGIRLNSATLSSATALAVNATNADGVDVSDFVATWDDSTNTVKGFVEVRKEGSGAVLGLFQITSVTDNTTWLQAALTYISGSGTFTAADGIYLTPYRVGNAGTNGSVAVSGTPTVNQFANWTDATTIKGTSITGLVKGNGASAPAAAVQGTDYYAPGGTDVAVLDGGTGSSTAAGARTNLGSTTVGDAVFVAANAAAARTAIGAVIGTDVLAYDSQLFSNIPQNSQSAAYTLVAADAQKHIYHPSADTTARIWTIPANSSVAYSVGTAITFINDTSAGAITISITTDTLVLAGAGTTGSRTLAASGIATAIKKTSTSWIISGTGLT